MKKGTLAILLVCVVAIVAFISLRVHAPQHAVRSQAIQGQFKVGEAFPAMVFPSAEDRHPISIADFRGKKVILHIFASW